MALTGGRRMRTEEEIREELSFFEGYLAGMNDDWSLDEKEVKAKIQALEFVLEESEANND